MNTKKTRDQCDAVIKEIEATILPMSLPAECKYQRMNQYIHDILMTFPDNPHDTDSTVVLVGQKEYAYEFVQEIEIHITSDRMTDIVRSIVEGRMDDFRAWHREEYPDVDFDDDVVRNGEDPAVVLRIPGIFGDAQGVRFFPDHGDTQHLIPDILDQTLQTIAQTNLPVEIQVELSMSALSPPIWTSHLSRSEKLTLEAHHLEVISNGQYLQYKPPPLKVNVLDLVLPRPPQRSTWTNHLSFYTPLPRSPFSV
jgi:hypothetical protein